MLLLHLAAETVVVSWHEKQEHQEYLCQELGKGTATGPLYSSLQEMHVCTAYPYLACALLAKVAHARPVPAAIVCAHIQCSMVSGPTVRACCGCALKNTT